MPRKNGQVNEKGVDENHLPDLYCIMQLITQARNRFCERGTCMKVTISDVAKLADVLGHSSIETTRIYLISTGAQHRRDLDRLRLVC